MSAFNQLDTRYASSGSIIPDFLEFQRNSRRLSTYKSFVDMCYLEEHKKQFASTLKLICSGNNRANGFRYLDYPSDENTEIEHWVFDAGENEKLQMQASNCMCCGGYLYRVVDDSTVWAYCHCLGCPQEALCKCEWEREESIDSYDGASD